MPGRSKKPPEAAQQSARPAIEPEPVSRVPPDVLAASEAFQLERDAKRYRWLIRHREMFRPMMFMRTEQIHEFIDKHLKRS